jgi:hypothetical protein
MDSGRIVGQMETDPGAQGWWTVNFQHCPLSTRNR